MASRRRLAIALLAQAVTVVGGVLAFVAWRSGFYATAVTAGLICLWTATDAAWRIATRDDNLAPPEPDRAPIHLVRAELAMLRALLDQIPAPIVMADPQGRLSAINLAARRLFGADGPILEPPEALTAMMTGADPPAPQILTLGEGAERRSYALSVTDAVREGEPVRLAVLADVQAELRAAEARALRDLLQVLSHEIMNSLTPVASLAESAEALLDTGDPAATASARDAVRTIARRAAGLNRFVQGYRDLARVPEPVFRREPVGPLLGDVQRLFETRWAGRGVMLAVTDGSEGAVVDLDRDLITQALIGLLANGAEAALSHREREARVELCATMEADRLQLRVHDNGPGVATDDPETLFLPFYTTKPGGSGVGLAIARQIALSHGGALALESREEGCGAGFLLSL